MSWNYTYYLGYEKEGKIYPLGVYDAKGKIYEVFSVSRSFASDLKDEFYPIKDEKISDKLRKTFAYKDYNDKEVCDVYCLPVSELGKSDFIKNGYFLIEEVQEYLETHDSEGLFYDSLTPEVFAAKLLNEAKAGPPKPKKDCEGETYYPHAASDYMYFAYPDYNSREYEVFRLKQAMDIYERCSLLDNATPVILMTQG